MAQRMTQEFMMQEAVRASANNFESAYMWNTSEASGEGGYAVGAIIRELARKSDQQEAEITALKQELLQRSTVGGTRRTLSEEKGSESIPVLVGDTNYRVWKFKVVTFIAEKHPTCKTILESLDNKSEITEDDMADWRDIDPG
eukprot:8587295-Karenia_brevis.AAC.1